MPRKPRKTPGGYVYHVLNRGVGRMTIFEKDEDYEAFEKVIIETCQRIPQVELFCYCLMPNHFHLLLRPKAEGELSEFMRLLTVTHTQRYHAHYHTSGTGPIYQGRFKSFPIETDSYFYVAARYVERNALQANLVDRAEDWRWSSLYARKNGQPELKTVLSNWPIGQGIPRNWKRQVNKPQTQKEYEAIETSLNRSRPLGNNHWVAKTAVKLDLESTLRSVGRPRKEAGNE